MKRRRATQNWGTWPLFSVAPSLLGGYLTLASPAMGSDQPSLAAAESSASASQSQGRYRLPSKRRPSSRLLEPTLRSRSLLPFWIDRTQGYRRTQALLLPPLWWKSSDARSQSQAQFLFPLAFWSRSPEQRALHTPLLSLVRGKEHRLNGLWPLLSFSSIRPDGRDQLVLGGAWWARSRRRNQSRHWGIGPLFWSFQRGQERSWWLPPLLSGLRTGPTRQLQMLTPLLWHSAQRKGKDQRWQHRWMAGPLFGSWGPKSRGLSLFPIWLHQRSAAIDFTLIPPLLSGYRRLDNDRSRTWFSPLFVRHITPTNKTTGIAGLFWDIQRPGERHSALFPLFYRHRSESRSGLWTPVGASWNDGQRQRFLWGPVFGQRSANSSTTGIFPLWAHHRGAKRQFDLIAPLWLRARTPERDLDLITPLIWRTKTRGKHARSAFAIAPLYFRKREPTGFDLDAGPGFFWTRDNRRRTHTLIAGPFYHRLTRKGLYTGLFPLTLWKDTVKERRLLVFPLIFHYENKRKLAHTTVAFPLWFDRQRSPHRRTWLAFPFVLGREFPRSFMRIGLGAPGFIDTFSLRKNRRITGWFPFFFRYQSCGFQAKDPDDCRYTAYGSVPLFYYGKNRRGDRLAHSALGLYYFEKNGARRKFLTLLGGIDQEPRKRLTWYAGPVYRSITNDKIRHGIVPLYLHSRDRLVDKRTTMILPPLFIKQHREDRRWFELGLLAWHFRSQHQVVTLLAPPIFGHQHTYAERKRSWLLPFYLDDHRMGQQARTTAIFPLLWFRNRNHNSKTSIQFPLWWDFQRGDERRVTLVLPPLWMDIRRSRNHRTRLIPGLWYNRDRLRDETTVLGPGLLWWTRHEDPNPHDSVAADRDWRALFGLFGGGRKEGRPYFSLVGKSFWLADDESEAAVEEDSGAAGVPVKEAPVRGSSAR